MNITRGYKLRQTMIKKHGSLEAWRQHMANIGRHGGEVSRGGGFAHPDADPSGAGKVGGTISKRGKRARK